jgi:hypothetical protein
MSLIRVCIACPYLSLETSQADPPPTPFPHLDFVRLAQINPTTLEYLTSQSEGNKPEFVTHDLTLGWKYWTACSFMPFRFLASLIVTS